ncbi:hypothetical protein [Amycolatopsis sp. NPDC004378]
MNGLSDRLVSWLRTIVPSLWSALITWLIALGLPDSVIGALNGLWTTVLMPVVFGLVYAGLRAVESRLPAWATRLLLGSNQTPSYGTSSDGTPRITSLPEIPPPPVAGGPST